MDSKNKTHIGYDLEKLGDADRYLWHAYNYGFRRVSLQTRDDCLPTDVGGKWFAADLAARAEIFWSRELGVPCPDV